MSFIIIGLFCAFGRWHATQEMYTIWGSIIIQVIGVVGYCIARIVSEEKEHYQIEFSNADI